MRRNSSSQWMVRFKLCLNFLFCLPVCSALWQPNAIGWAHFIIASYQKWQKNIRLSLLTQMLHYFHIDFALYQYCAESQCHLFHFYNTQFYICLNWINKSCLVISLNVMKSTLQSFVCQAVIRMWQELLRDALLNSRIWRGLVEFIFCEVFFHFARFTRLNYLRQVNHVILIR